LALVALVQVLEAEQVLTETHLLMVLLALAAEVLVEPLMLEVYRQHQQVVEERTLMTQAAAVQE
jgi:hypothetical protein